MLSRGPFERDGQEQAGRQTRHSAEKGQKTRAGASPRSGGELYSAGQWAVFQRHHTSNEMSGYWVILLQLKMCVIRKIGKSLSFQN